MLNLLRPLCCVCRAQQRSLQLVRQKKVNELYQSYFRRVISTAISETTNPTSFTNDNAKAKQAEELLDTLDTPEATENEKLLKMRKIWELAKAASEEGSIRGQTLQGFMYSEGIVVGQDLEKAEGLLRRAAEEGDPYAQYGLGKLLLERTMQQKETMELVEEPKDFEVEADAAGNVRGRLRLFNKGDGSKDKEGVQSAAQLVRKVRKERRKEGFSDAEALEYEDYKIRKREEREREKRNDALSWLKLAADQDVAPASVLYGDAILQENAPLARDYYMKATKELKDPQIFYRLGQLYYDGASGVDADQKAAVKNFSMAASLGDASAQFFLGQAHRIGDMGLELDTAAALNYTQMAAEQRHPAALYQLATMHKEGGAGLQPSIQVFRRYLHEAASLGYADALFYLAEMHYKGVDGVNIDYKTALKYYRDAGTQGSADALCCAAAMHFHGIGTAQSYEKAFNLYQEAMVHGNTRAMVCLGSMYQEGQYVPKSEERAKYLFNLAEEHEQMKDREIKEQEERVKNAGRVREPVTAKTRTPRSTEAIGCGGGPD